MAGVKRREGRESSEAAAREERRGRWERSDEAGGREAAVRGTRGGWQGRRYGGIANLHNFFF